MTLFEHPKIVGFVIGDHLNEPDCDVLTCDEIEGTYFHLDGGLVSFVEHDDSNHVTVLVRDPRDGTIIDDDSGIDLGNGKFQFAAAGNAWLEDRVANRGVREIKNRVTENRTQ